MENTSKKKVTLILSLICAVAALILLGIDELLPAGVRKFAEENSDVELIIKTAVRAVLSALLILVIKKIPKAKIGISRIKLKKGIFRYGLILICAIALQLFSSYQKPEKSFVASLPSLLILIVGMMFVGIYEELLCRGLLFNAFRKYFGESKKAIYLSVFLSSLIFGLMHLGNLISSPELKIATAAQVIYATFFGVIFAVIYYRTDNLLPCIILHGVFDMTDGFWKCFVTDREEQIQAADVTDISVGDGLIVVTLTSLFVIAGLVQLRKEFKTRAALAAA